MQKIRKKIKLMLFILILSMTYMLMKPIFEMMMTLGLTVRPVLMTYLMSSEAC